ncbi:hypothetical protein PHLCEN_2v12587 [Hermanssonia centrifuga]|uniref:Uncharacterized protein n=1 Tax=Hermanssonia centrifuga TaxID=98765 RepID=A0A2R6NGP8_9APHY|nr:hypothetical protein PHLCEN_2v12587 [Hermanssonia centrifuga]
MKVQIPHNIYAASPAPWSPKGHVQPHHGTIPRRRNPKRIVFYDVDTDTPKEKEPPAMVATPVKCAAPAEADMPVATDPLNPAPKGPIQPHRSHLPRRRNPKPIVFHDVETDSPAEKKCTVEPLEVEAPVTTDPDPLAPAFIADDPSIQEVLSILVLAFKGETSPSASLPGHSDKSYTHVLSITYGAGEGTSEEIYKDRIHHLRLTLPAAAVAEGAPRAGLGLTVAQIRASRDFIAQALPNPLAQPADRSDVRILITAPHKRPTDAMCVLACYLAFTSGKAVEDILLHFDGDEEFLSVWKGEVSGEEVEKVEKIARSWSWLSSIVQMQRT